MINFLRIMTLVMMIPLVVLSVMVSLASEPDAPGSSRAVRNSLRQKLSERIKERLGPSKLESDSQPEDRTLEFAGRTRTYRLHLPDRVPTDKPLPLVVVLHGAGANGQITELLTGFSELADEKGFVAVYPDGEKGIWRFWEGPAKGGKRGPASAGAGDTEFLSALIDELVRQKVADPQRVYVTGISNGAYMSNKLGCSLSDRVAAIAPVSGTLPKRMADQLKPSRPLPVLYIHGTADKIVGVQGADLFSKHEVSLPAAELAAWWARRNGCLSPPHDDELPDSAADGTTVVRHTYDAGESGAPVVYYEIREGGHTWPGGSAQPERLLGKTCRDLNASQVIWEFFTRFSLPRKEGRD